MKALFTLLTCIGIFHLDAAEEPISPPLVSVDEARPKPSPAALLQKMWHDDLSKREAFKLHKNLLSHQIFESERIVVREVSGEEAFKRIDGTLHARERSLILTGDLATLRKQAKLTEIHNPGTIGNGFSAYLDSDGRLILMWVIPEG